MKTIIASALCVALFGCVHISPNINPRQYCVNTIDVNHCVLDETPQSPYRLAEAKRKELQHHQRVQGRLYVACALAATAACYAFVPGCIERGGTKALLIHVPLTIGMHAYAEKRTDATQDSSVEELVDDVSLADCMWDIGVIATH